MWCGQWGKGMSVATILNTGQQGASGAQLNDAGLGVSISSLTQFARVRLLQFGVSTQDADDLAQDIMINMMRQLPSFEIEKGSLESWITGFAKMAAKAWMRQRALKLQREVPLELAPGVAAEVEGDELLANAIQRALSKLPEVDRLMVDLRFSQGLSSKQISDRMGMSDMAVRKRLSRAIERVRKDSGLREALYF